MIYIDISRPKSSFHPRYRIFPRQPFPPFALSSFIVPLCRLLSLSPSPAPSPSPPHGPLYQTKQSRSRSGERRLLRAVLGDNLYTNAGYLCNNLLSLDTSFSRARRPRRRFPPALYLRGLLPREDRIVARVHTFGVRH